MYVRIVTVRTRVVIVTTTPLASHMTHKADIAGQSFIDLTSDRLCQLACAVHRGFVDNEGLLQSALRYHRSQLAAVRHTILSAVQSSAGLASLGVCV